MIKLKHDVGEQISHIPLHRKHKTKRGVYRLVKLVLICSLLSLSVTAKALDFTNTRCQSGEQLSVLPGENGRTMFIDFIDDRVITNRHSRGVFKVWNLDDPRNPFMERQYHNRWTGSHVHSYLPGNILVTGWGGWTHIDITDAHNLFQTNARFNRRNSSMTQYPIGFRGVPSSYGYDRNRRTIDIVDLKTGERLSSIPVMDQTGFVRPNMVEIFLL